MQTNNNIYLRFGQRVCVISHGSFSFALCVFMFSNSIEFVLIWVMLMMILILKSSKYCWWREIHCLNWWTTCARHLFSICLFKSSQMKFTILFHRSSGFVRLVFEFYFVLASFHFNLIFIHQFMQCTFHSCQFETAQHTLALPNHGVSFFFFSFFSFTLSHSLHRFFARSVYSVILLK